MLYLKEKKKANSSQSLTLGAKLCLSSCCCVSVLLCPLNYRAITHKEIWSRILPWQLQGLFYTLLIRSAAL